MNFSSESIFRTSGHGREHGIRLHEEGFSLLKVFLRKTNWTRVRNGKRTRKMDG
jgi:hypothetical protein